MSNQDLSIIQSRLADLKNQIKNEKNKEAKQALQEQYSILQEEETNVLNAHKVILQDNVESCVKENDVFFLSRKTGMYYYKDDVSGNYVPSTMSALKQRYIEFHSAEASNYLSFYIAKEKLSYSEITSSWNIVPQNTKNLLEKNFVETVDAEYSFTFDILMKSLGGGKQENITHIEKLILTKYLNPSNFMLPALVFTHDEGGTGKTFLTSKLMPTIFGGAQYVAANAKIDNLIGKFNNVIDGKAVVFVNEVSSEKADSDALKNIIHSPKVTLELKGIDSFEIDNLPLYILAGNKKDASFGTILLANDITDRRYSIVMPGKSLIDHINDYLILNQLEPSEENNKAIRELMEYDFADAMQVGAWIHHLIQKYGKMTHVDALHGQDYQTLLNIQKPFITRFFEHLFFEIKPTKIKKLTAFEYYKHCSFEQNAGTRTKNKGNFYVAMEEWIEKNAPHYKETKAAAWNELNKKSTADVLFDQNVNHKNRTDSNDYEFYEDMYGKKTWKVIWS